MTTIILVLLILGAVGGLVYFLHLQGKNSKELDHAKDVIDFQKKKDQKREDVKRMSDDDVFGRLRKYWTRKP